MALHYDELQPADLPKHRAWQQQSMTGALKATPLTPETASAPARKVTEALLLRVKILALAP